MQIRPRCGGSGLSTYKSSERERSARSRRNSSPASAHHDGDDALIYECEFRLANGERRQAEVMAVAFADEQSKTVVAQVRDVTRQRRAREALMRLASFPEQDPNPVVEIDTAGTITFANSCANGQFPEIVQVSADHPLFGQLVTQADVLGAGNTTVTRHAIAYNDRYYDVRACPVPGLPLLRVFINDVTHLRKTQLDLERSLEELGATQRQLIDASRMAGRSEVATSVLHNIGNALTSVKSSASIARANATEHRMDVLLRVVELLRDQLETPDNREMPLGKIAQLLEGLHAAEAKRREAVSTALADLDQRVEHVTAVIHAQQRFAKGSDEGYEHTTPRELVEEALTMALPGQHHGELAIEIDGDDDSASWFDRHRVLQILINLIGNARDAILQVAGSESRIHIHVSSTDSHISFAVTDSGCGIERENLTRLFRHGFTTKPDGHGFGLHGSACAAMEMRGRLSASSDGPGRGATFLLEVPRVSRERATA